MFPGKIMASRGLLSILLVASLLLLVLACLLGSTPLGLERFVMALFNIGSAGDQIVVWEIRLPRAIAAYIVGASLGISGAALQGLLRNPLADPGVLGVSATASLAATFTLYYGLAGVSSYFLPLSAVLGALVATALLSVAAVKLGSVVTLILVGVAVSSFAGALMALLMNLAPNPFSLSDMINWMLGSVANRSYEDIALTLPFMLLGAALLFFSRRGLSALTLGEEAAEGIGLNLPRTRTLIVLGAGIATGGAVALAGAVGFVGIVAPHFVRPFVKHEPAATLLPSALLGGCILLAADILLRVLPTNVELKLGVVAALIGAPAFVWIATQRSKLHD
ncbi:MAG: iron complex transport system permease protein [Patiriisocius sp.]|jgi:iron complex transport system permease protein